MTRTLVLTLGFVLCGCSPIATTRDAALLTSANPRTVRGGARVEQIGNNLFQVRLSNVAAIRTSQPEHTQLCWAACAEMVLRSQGAAVNQDALSRHFVGSDMHSSVNVLTLLRALNPDQESQYLNTFRPANGSAFLTHDAQARILFSQVHSDFLVDALSEGHPVVVGLSQNGAQVGHICVVVGATYAVARPPKEGSYFHASFLTNKEGNRDERFIANATEWTHRRFALESVEIIDPDPAAAPSQTLSAQDFKSQVDFLVTADLASAYLRELIRLAPRPEEKTRTTTTTHRHRGSWSVGTRR